MNSQPKAVRNYLQEIGRKGGKQSRRTLSPLHARRMVAVREARKAFAEHKTDCFWSFDPDWQVSTETIPLVIQTLKAEGNRDAFEKARTLQRLWERSSCQ